MNVRTACRLLAVCCLCLSPPLAHAWWDDHWSSRKQISVDGGITGADVKDTLTDVPVLLRLHLGNFAFFSELAPGGRDLRFIDNQGLPLKHALARLDAANDQALVWIKLPQVRGGVSSDAFWMYYGNGNAPDASDSKGLYDTAQSLVFHFGDGEALPKDATAYASHAADSKAQPEPAGWIGSAARFTGAGGVSVNPAPQLAIAPEPGWTFSTWVRIDQPQGTVSLVSASEGGNGLSLELQGTALTARYQGPAGQGQTTAANLALGRWQYVALTADKAGLHLYVDGAPVGHSPVSLAAFTPTLRFGEGLVGLLDEIQVARTARSADWIKLQFRSQSPDFTLLSFGQDEGKESGGGTSYFVIILQSLTVDGWVVIALCGVMFVISSLVMVTKGLAISRARKDNRAFLAQYRDIDASDPGALDQDESEEEKEFADSDFLTALVGKHDHFQSSPIYHVYHAGVQELKKRVARGGSNRMLTPEALNVIRARLDAAVVRESQKLNRSMVLLTIAISGGPFLGLLGTVLGVMITFAVIAATGDVNINSIAPGISGALLATVAGLAVAIPALFGYNYLLTQIKDLTADMHVFTDEFLAMVSERAADLQREG
ncbi:DUF2341 domain-containing protein [Methyloterricola oryzae]|uniref:DUF2341 domain-containing protein n=1 Tax=Methyloterricola oryzae TaxID=1495050 RepID=UPI0005EAF045|nr:DUF2341 domain-containing protein [Methyloterricola oryzae]